jgi:hypothetical protein
MIHAPWLASALPNPLRLHCPSAWIICSIFDLTVAVCVDTVLLCGSHSSEDHNVYRACHAGTMHGAWSLISDHVDVELRQVGFSR